MPFDAIVMSAAVVAMFVVFAAIVLWGDLQTRPDRLQTNAKAQQPQASADRRPEADRSGRRAA